MKRGETSGSDPIKYFSKNLIQRSSQDNLLLVGQQDTLTQNSKGNSIRVGGDHIARITPTFVVRADIEYDFYPQPSPQEIKKIEEDMISVVNSISSTQI